MKRLLFVLLMAITFVACEGPTGPPGRDGQDGSNTEWHIIEHTVRPNQWELVEGREDELGTYYTYVFDVPELRSDIANNGAVLMYKFNSVENAWTPLPYTVPLYDEENGYEILYTEACTFDYSTGSIKLYFDISNFYTGKYKPRVDMIFKIVLIY